MEFPEAAGAAHRTLDGSAQRTPPTQRSRRSTCYWKYMLITKRAGNVLPPSQSMDTGYRSFWCPSRIQCGLTHLFTRWSPGPATPRPGTGPGS